MIPLQLRLRNFMCYRDNVPTLDFSGIHLACLTGANGHGKSALLDAITWALWGKARAKHDDELIHQGQSEMEVEFGFDLGGTVYRVLRKRDSTKAGRTLLDLQVQHAGGFRSLAEATVRATQAAINRLLRMDYETFTNSALLLQGKADSFTTRTPADRKQVLGDILGLGLFDELEQRARERAREKEREAAELDALLREIDRELARQPEVERELAEAEATVSRLAAAHRETEASLLELRHAQQVLEQEQVQLRDLDRRLAQAGQELEEIVRHSSERTRRLHLYEQVMAQRAQIEQGYAAFLSARGAEVAWTDKAAQAMMFQNQQQLLERAVAGARQRLEVAMSRPAERIRELERRAGAAHGCEQELAEARLRLAQLAQLQAERDTVQARLQSLAEESASIQVRNEHLRSEMDSLTEKLGLLQRESGEAECPLCGQALSGEHRGELEAQFHVEGKALADAHRANDSRRREIAGLSRQWQADIRRLEQEAAPLAALQRREAQLEQSLADAQQATGQLESARQELRALEEQLARGDYALAERAELVRLAASLGEVAYDAEAHQKVRAELAALAGFEEKQRQLQQAHERAGEERAALAELRAREARWQESRARDQAQRSILAEKVMRLPEVADRVRASARDLEDLHTAASRARLVLGGARQKLESCERRREERKQHAASHQRAAEEKAAFDELRLAFGKKGIQAMIIEAAIPEIEFEANRLLSRMTDGRMHVRLETQRETLKREPVETLDINIADELGTRAYELFSGGEAFRVNFAIRISLSRLLARRSGAQLEMLVIDEGFGTQDAEGRERLVEAITSIQDDFQRILVVTHIEDLKDAFPAHIRVVKTDAGSQISLN